MKFTTQYEQVYSVDLRSIIRDVVISGLATFYQITDKISSALGRNRIQFLYLHHLFEDEEDSFRNLLLVLSQRHRFISYSEAVQKILQGNIERPYISLSFDDGLKNCLGAARIMKEFGIKVCFFLCTSMVGETNYQKIKEFCAKRIHFPPMEFMSWDDVEILLKEGHEIGSHTMAHSNLTQLSVRKIQAEITESFQVLTKRVGSIKHFAWPYGRFFHFSPTAAKIVFETGFKSCASAERGCHVTAQSERQEYNLCIRRDHIIAKWPINHILYFLAKNSRKASIQNNYWPSGWLATIQGKA